MNEQDTRLACLELAVSLALADEDVDVLDVAEQMFEFVAGRSSDD